jgi:amino acid transporter
MHEEDELVKALGFYDLTAIGIGSIIGCGIFFLFSNILQRAGPLTALAFVFAAVPNIIASLSYAELASMYDSNAVEYECLKDSFNETVASVSIYVLLAFLVFNSTTIILFASHILNLQHIKFYFCLVVLFVLSIVNYFGIDVSKKITNTMGFIELAILLIVIIFGARYWHHDPSFFAFNTNKTVKPQTFWVASFLAIFLYTGYDAVVKLSEETKDSKKNVPKSVICTVLITASLYILIAFTAICLPRFRDIASSVMPIGQMFEQIFGPGSYIKIVYLIGLFIVLNTFFVCIISLSRFLYGLSKEKKLPHVLSDVNDHYNTPHNAILVVFVLVALSVMIDNGEWAASFANIFYLIFLVMLSMAVIILRLKQPDRERPFKIPMNVGNVPIPVVCGIFIYIGYLVLVMCSTHKIG